MIDRMHRLRAWARSRPAWMPDTALAASLAAVQLWVLFVTGPETPGFEAYAGPTPLAVALTLLATLPLALRRRNPAVVLAVIGGAMVASAPLVLPAPGFGLVVALYSYAALTEDDDGLFVLLVFGGFALVSMLLADAIRFAPINLVVFVTAWALGDRQRQERLRTAELQRRARALEHERELTSALATATERNRIAHELHDVVAHGVTAMVTQATAAERLITTEPARAAAALQDAEQAGRGSLAELRRLLGLLRGGDEHPALVPQPGIDDIPELVAAFADIGLETSCEISGPVDNVPASAGLSAYRIVQEGLTNVLVHARATRVDVRLHIADGRLEVSVTDDGVAPAQEGDTLGRGLLGVRERVALLGGSVRCGAGLGRGYALEASLPLGGAR